MLKKMLKEERASDFEQFYDNLLGKEFQPLVLCHFVLVFTWLLVTISFVRLQQLEALWKDSSCIKGKRAPPKTAARLRDEKPTHVSLTCQDALCAWLHPTLAPPSTAGLASDTPAASPTVTQLLRAQELHDCTHIQCLQQWLKVTVS